MNFYLYLIIIPIILWEMVKERKKIEKFLVLNKN
jgi:hypothetical protein